MTFRVPRCFTSKCDFRFIIQCEQRPFRAVLSPVDYCSDTQAVTTGRHGDVVVCWHPERKFPYEHSKPIPRSEDTLVTVGINPPAEASFVCYSPLTHNIW